MFCVSEFFLSSGEDASEAGFAGQPPLLHARDVRRGEGGLLRGSEGAEVHRRQRGRGVLPGRGPAGPHPVPAATSLPAQRRRQQLGGLMG